LWIHDNDMKLVPNLEKAVEFGAEHGQGKIADDLKKVIWDTQLGIYNTLSEGLDAMAYAGESSLRNSSAH